MNKRFIPWEAIHQHIKSLASKIDRKNYKYVCGIPRGGMIPAAMLAYELDLPLTTSVSKSGCLLVDDICDSGKTLLGYTNSPLLSPNIVHTATIYYKPEALIKPDYYADVIESDIWILFPWENKNEEAIQGYLKQQ
jgi:hypothetical protein